MLSVVRGGDCGGACVRGGQCVAWSGARRGLGLARGVRRSRRCGAWACRPLAPGRGCFGAWSWSGLFPLGSATRSLEHRSGASGGELFTTRRHGSVLRFRNLAVDARMTPHVPRTLTRTTDDDASLDDLLPPVRSKPRRAPRSRCARGAMGARRKHPPRTTHRARGAHGCATQAPRTLHQAAGRHGCATQAPPRTTHARAHPNPTPPTVSHETVPIVASGL